MNRLLTAALLLVLVAAPAQAGKFNKKMNIGDKLPAFTELPGTDDNKYGADNFKDKDVLVVVVTCNHCPVAVAYEDRIIAFTKKHAGKDSKVGIVAINVNTIEQDRLDKMKERAKDKGFNFTYCYDESQKTGRSLGASVTPEFFVFDKERRLVYTGAMDDNMKADQVEKHYLNDAVDAALKGETPKTATSARKGCGIQYDRKKSD